MHIALVFHMIGRVVSIVGACMVFPLLWAWHDGSADLFPILYGMLITLAVGAALTYFLRPKDDKKNLRARESFAIVTLGWIFASFFGSLPYLFSGYFPTFADAFFETMSGFTTTGASILSTVESLPRGILFWRSMTHWLGGMGIMVLFVALISNNNSNSGIGHVYKAEAPGPVKEKIAPKASEGAKILWLTYIILSVILFFLLLLGGMSVFDAFCHTFGTMATGGFSTKNASIGFYDSAYIQWVITIFMFLAGVNFSLYYLLFIRKINNFFKNEEFRYYFFLSIGATLLIFFNIYYAGVGSSAGETLRYAAFTAVSTITTTGYAVVDYIYWPLFAQGIIFLLLFAGGCTGSTSGSIKAGRFVILIKNIKIELSRLVHPKSVNSLKVNQRNQSDDLVRQVLQFFFIYMGIFLLSSVVLMLFNINFDEAITAAATCLGNVGPGVGAVGPFGNYGFLPSAAKFLLSFLMLLGRLELYTVLVLLSPSIWRKE